MDVDTGDIRASVPGYYSQPFGELVMGCVAAFDAAFSKDLIIPMMVDQLANELL